jgi:hypothetical protein
MLYTLSTGLKFVDKDGNTIDNGIEPDYEIVKVNEDGSKDFSELYNYSRISALFSEFYGSKTGNDPQTVTTDPAATATTTTTTTTTTTNTSSTASTESTSASSTATSAAAATSTTAADPAELPQTGNNAPETAAAAACAVFMAAVGGALMLTSGRLSKKEDL